MSRIEELIEFLKEDPQDNFSAYALALEYVKLSNNPEAIRLLEELLQRNPEYLAAYYQLGKLYEMQQDLPRSTSTFLKGMEVARKQNNLKTLNELRAAYEIRDE